MPEFHEICRLWLAWITAASWQLAVLVGLVALVARLAAKSSPRLRHALWLLVLAKVFLPPALTTPVSFGRLVVGPLLDAAGLSDANWAAPAASGRSATAAEAGDSRFAPAAPGVLSRTAPLDLVRDAPGWLMAGWALGAGLFWALVGGRYLRMLRSLKAAAVIDEGPVCVALERAALEVGVARTPELLAANQLGSPFLFGVLRPRIVLPQAMLERIDDAQLHAVLAHELLHCKRRDTWIGWLQTLAQSAFWFHPFLWWANSRLRHERECACDDAVLRQAAVSPEQYGQTIVGVLTSLRGRSTAEGGMIGVFERGSKLQDRLEEIMSYRSNARRFGWKSRLAVSALAILCLPMAPGGSRTQAAAEAPNAGAEGTQTKHPQIVRTIPKIGATDVDPALGEIAVTFDREMGQGMSWTGGPPWFPPVDESRKARWTDGRTCVLPVKLAGGSYYRLGVNSTGRQNFRSQAGEAAPPAVLYFATKGAAADVAARVKVPEIASIAPENGAADADPQTSALRVTFTLPMDEGMSWTGGGPQFPKLAEGQKASWSADGFTCTLPVSLEPNHDYQLGLNSLSYNNFQSRFGVPLKPVVYKFRTHAGNGR